VPPDPDHHFAPSALAAAGQLRECVAAARNLEHLAGSLSVGPQVLAHVVPDVATMLGEYPKLVNEALRCAQVLGVELSEAEQQAVVGESLERVQDLLVFLSSLAASNVHAKSRLILERKLARVVPLLVTAVAHAELILDLAQSEPAEMSIFELLTSMPQRGSDRPHQPISVRGEGLDRMVSVAPRVGLKLLSAWVSSVTRVQIEPWGLNIHADDRQATFSVGPGAVDGFVVRLPVFFPSPLTLRVVAAALRAYSGEIMQTSLIFPTKGQQA